MCETINIWDKTRQNFLPRYSVSHLQHVEKFVEFYLPMAVFSFSIDLHQIVLIKYWHILKIITVYLQRLFLVGLLFYLPAFSITLQTHQAHAERQRFIRTEGKLISSSLARFRLSKVIISETVTVNVQIAVDAGGLCWPSFSPSYLPLSASPLLICSTSFASLLCEVNRGRRGGRQSCCTKASEDWSLRR